MGKKAGWMKKQATSPLLWVLLEANNYARANNVDIKTALDVVMENKGSKIAESLIELAKNDANTLRKLKEIISDLK